MKSLRFLAVFCAVVAAIWVFRQPLQNEVFDLLVSAEPPSKADVAVVLGGDHNGLRVLTAGQLVKDGFVPVAIVNGPDEAYGNFECDLAIPYAVAHGYPESYFRHFHGTFTNTADEAATTVAELQRTNVKKVLIVTSGYHTRRASRYFHVPGLEAHMIAAPDRYANHGTWWNHREGRKTVFLEWSKTVATWLGI